MRRIISRSFIHKSFIGKSFIKVTAFLLAVGALSATARAEQYPGGRPIEMTVMFGAGSAADVTARYLADGIAKLLGVPVPVVNRTGGGGAIGYSYVSKQKPDGHSIIWNSNSISSTYHSGVLPFDYTAFDPVARVSLETPAIAVRADAPGRACASSSRTRSPAPARFASAIPGRAAIRIFLPPPCSRVPAPRSSKCRSAKARPSSICSAAESKA